MKKLTYIIFATLVLASLGHAKDVFKFSNLPPTGNEEAVLVLAPGLNNDGSFFLKEAPWSDFAKIHNLGLIALNYKSNSDQLYFDKKGYYYPEQGSGKALLDEINRIYKKDLPIIIYGFSGGAQFTGRFIEYAPDRVIAWCAYSAQTWDYPKKPKSNARGIVACGQDDGTRWQPSFSFFLQGRKDSRNWIWVSISNTGHNRSAKFENFIRNFFAEEIQIWKGEKAPQADIFQDVSNSENELLMLSEQPELQNVFRTKELLDNWRIIQEK